jgi:V8-like Glu-specific endopeptidase
MSITRPDDRAATSDFTTFPLNAVVAVDSQYIISLAPPIPPVDEYGSGLIIDPNHVLTAGHNVFHPSFFISATNTRTTVSPEVIRLRSRMIGVGFGDPISNVMANPFFPKDYTNSAISENDIALLRTNNSLISAVDTVGLLAFVNPKNARNLSIVTAGYPTVPPPPAYSGTTLVISPGHDTGNITSTNGVRFYYSDSVDTEPGQSGSGVWHILGGDITPRVLGVHIKGYDPNAIIINQNSGILLTTDVYTTIINQVQADSGIANADILPENALVGSDTNQFSAITSEGNDNITGSYRKERILGRSGDDRLFGGGANDRLEGGSGTDQALFSDIFTNYTYRITDPANKFFEFDHNNGNRADGKDSLKEIEFGVFEYIDSNQDGQDDDGQVFYVPLQVDPNTPAKLKDGSEISPEQDILDNNGDKLGTITVKSPAWTFDGDVNYSLSLGAKLGKTFNIAFVIDTSLYRVVSPGFPESLGISITSSNENSFLLTNPEALAAPLAEEIINDLVTSNPFPEVKNALQTYIQSLINAGITTNSRFAVIPFNDTASITGPIDAATASSTIGNLSTAGFTDYGDALSKAQQFFQNRNGTNIAYFVSYNSGLGASENLQSVAEVRAFGIGSRADRVNLNIIDSGDAVSVNNGAGLVSALTAATIDKNTIDHIDVKLGGVVVSTINPNDLAVDAFGRLNYAGTIDRLTVSRTAENHVSFELIFNNGTPTTILNYKITSGQQEVRTQSVDGTREIVTFSVDQSGFNESASSQITSREINGNDLANTITVSSGNNVLHGNGGIDRFILNGGINFIDGGEGIDTVKINQTQATVGTISKTGNIVNVGTETTLLNIEFIELNDVRLAVDTLTVTPIITLLEQTMTINEGNTGSKTVTFTTD